MTKTPTTYCYVTDHLGSVRTTYRITEESESVPVQHISYMPSGAVIKDSQPSLQKRRFTGKELITMHGWNMYDSYARFLYRVMPRFSSSDPMCEKYYSISPYAYCLNNPVRFIDPTGREVKAVFNRETHKLYILDLDYYNKVLPIVWVSAKDYQLGGIRDKDGNLTHNQILVINNVFSGGQIENKKIVRDSADSHQLAIPNAKYDIVDNNADTRHTGWFRLDRQDYNRYNDKDDVTGRDGYRFHLGGLSWGCVTVDKTQDNAQGSWDIVSSILNSTSTTTVSEKRGRQWLNPFSKLIRYGTLEVKGADKIPFKKQ